MVMKRNQIWHTTAFQTLQVTTLSLPPGVVGTVYSASLNAIGGIPNYTWVETSGTLPPGLTLAGNTISGTPTATGNSLLLVFKVTDSAGSVAFTISLAISVTSGGINRMGGLISADGGGAFSSELYPNFKNRFREGYIATGPSPDASGWPSAAYSFVAYGGAGVPAWAVGTFKCGFIGTGTPSALLACASSCGRNSPIRGTIQPWRTSQLKPKSSQAAATSHSKPRMATAIHRRRNDGKAGGSDGMAIVGSIDPRIMTADCLAPGAEPRSFVK